MIRRPPRSTLSSSSAASDVYKRQYQRRVRGAQSVTMHSLFVGSIITGLAFLVLASSSENPTPSFVEPVQVTVSETHDCRTDKTSTPISIDFDNESGKTVRIRGCQNQYACKPFQDCVVGMEAGAKASVTLDKSFKYFIFTYHGDGRDTEMYPDANLKYPSSYEIKAPSISAVAEVAVSETHDCRTDKTSTPISIDFDNESGKTVRIRGCQNQYACKPFQDCVVGMEAGAKASVTLDKSFKYFIFTYHGDGRDTEMYPDANLKYPSSYEIKAPTTNFVATHPVHVAVM
eukprot:TRINITY_DN697_c0_g1_i1.p1 TRINITY_DN697_c0_g1~~TRINITY_DN697_c0_g1_i1.p1  ORF type:complete len:288 (-),score=56.78 TRINITY_DN697_c0_g1_i1:70-933(-)